MEINEIYELAIDLGIESDLRGKEKVYKFLEKNKKKYELLNEKEKEFFDFETLKNPYSDTRILVDNNKSEIKKILTGIDIDGSELLLAEKIGADLVIAHHPEGSALAGLHNVMGLQSEVLADYGIPINIAEALMKPRILEVERHISPCNHNKSVDFAKILKLDFMCTHTIADNLGAKFLYNIFENNKNIETVGDVVSELLKIDEFKIAKKQGMGPIIFVGSEDNSCGKIAITEFTGGTSGSKEIYENMANAGIGTIIGMHINEEYRKEAEKYHINVVIAGHIASDSLGMNLFLDKLEKKGIEIIPCSGLIRIKR